MRFALPHADPMAGVGMPDTPSPPIIADAWAAAAMFAGLAAGPVERAAVLYLDPNWRLLGRSDFVGDARSIVPPMRAIIARALYLDAAAVVLGHGHPSGCAKPSAADLDYTRRLARVTEAVELILVDHLILAGNRAFSMRDAGLL